MLTVLQTALEVGLIYGLVALALFISFSILNIADLSTDGCFTLGCAVGAMLTIAGHPILALFAAMAAGMLSGYITAFLQTRLGVESILAGIISNTGLYTINLAVMGFSSNVSITGVDTVFSLFKGLVGGQWSRLILLALIAAVIVLVLIRFFGTSLGLSIRATGDSLDMVSASSINPKATITIGLCLANALTALSGCLIGEYNKFCDINLGTGMVTIALASLIIGEVFAGRRGSVGKRVVCVVLGSIVYRFIIALALPLASWIEMLAGANLRLQIAFAHIIFNVVTTLLLLPLSGLLEKLAYLVVRGEDKQEEPMRLEYFDTRLFSTPPVAVQQLFREVQRMADIVTANYRFAMQYYFAPKDLSVDEFDNNEQVIDYLNAEITQNLIELKGLNLRSEDIRLVGSLFHVVNDLERIGDHSMNIVEIGSARKKEKLRFSGKAEREIEELSGIVTSMLDKSIHIVRQQITDVEIIGEVIELESQVDKLCETLADHHVERVKNKKCTPRNGMLYLDMLNNLERIADHADNLASSVEPDHHDNRLLW